jgi:hypothetical protein
MKEYPDDVKLQRLSILALLQFAKEVDNRDRIKTEAMPWIVKAESRHLAVKSVVCVMLGSLVNES